MAIIYVQTCSIYKHSSFLSPLLHLKGTHALNFKSLGTVVQAVHLRPLFQIVFVLEIE